MASNKVSPRPIVVPSKNDIEAGDMQPLDPEAGKPQLQPTLKEQPEAQEDYDFIIDTINAICSRLYSEKIKTEKH
jgi:hypothetical protein